MAQSPEVYFNYCRYNSPQNESYIETYLSVIGNSLAYKTNANNKFQAELEITILLKQGEKIIDFKKNNLFSPEYSDSLFKNFVDLQRLVAPSGNYELEVSIRDLNRPEAKPMVHSENVSMEFTDTKVEISDIELIESFKKTEVKNTLTKGSHDLVPYVSSFYPKTLNKLTFYSEIYNTALLLGNDEKFLASYYLEGFENPVRLQNFTGFARRNADKVVVLFNEFNIEKLPTGNYNLVIEVRNKENELLAQKKQFIQRSNLGAEISLSDIAGVDINSSFVSKYASNDTVAEMIKCLIPIASRLEMVFIENQLNASDIKLKQQFFYSFWSNRNYPDPEGAWKKYLVEVNKVEKAYGTKIKRGYESDRGRVYLKYGPPSSVNANYNEPDAYPYEIWQYYKIEGFSNRKFIFYNPDLVTNDFSLLHSDMFGEVNNPRWQVALHSRSNQILDLDEEGLPNKYYGSDSDDLFRSPR